MWVKETEFKYKGEKIEGFKLSNETGMVIRVSNFAASLTDVIFPDKKGNLGHVVLGLDSLSDYLNRQPKLGATVGRYAGRINGASFSLDGKFYKLDGYGNSLFNIHGGLNGFHTKIFNTDSLIMSNEYVAVTFSHFSPHLESGFPGNLTVTVTYKLTNNNEVIIEYGAHTDTPTVINLTNHSYFNLSGGKESVLEHKFYIPSNSVCQIDNNGLPTGKFLSVKNSNYDFTKTQRIKKRITKRGAQYDNYYLFGNSQDTLHLAAVINHTKSGRTLSAYTTEPGFQFYVPKSNLNYLKCYKGLKYGSYYGFCLEMQHCPDSPNHSNFPSTLLTPDKPYKQTTIYKFSLK